VKGQKGITLIALIITIIVMLILVAVAVSTVVSSDLFNDAKEAGEKWKTEQANEANTDFDFYNELKKHGVTTTIDAP